MMREVSSVWGIVLIVGVVFLGFGIVLLFDVAAGERVVAVIVGAFLVFSGIIEAAVGDQTGGSRAVSVIFGLVLVVGGIVAIAWPGVTILAIAVIFGITILIGGLARIIGSLVFRDEGWGWLLTIGVVEAVVGIGALVWPRKTAYVVLILIGIYAIIAGLVQIMLAFGLRRAGERARA
ncbi:MAG TPA: DUF308 domain-containing protein [Acidimicrobiia bacterium]|nr:DUF308 domain-containing protein [Acidimicrobiia bacterium]